VTARYPPVFALVLSAWLSPAALGDTVTISTGGGGRSHSSGRVVDYTGQGLRLELSDGRQKEFAADRILQVQTQYVPEQLSADALYAQGKFAQALALYGRARASEQRRWVQRGITARMVWCHRALGAVRLAGEEFVLLVRSDPSMLYCDCIPLAWAPSSPPAPLVQAARRWLVQKEMPAALLLGASHLLLLPTADRPALLAELDKLASGSDERIRALALGQRWRVAVATADAGEIETWSRAIEAMPEPFRAGPYYVLGRAWAQQRRWEQAALALLRIPILSAEHHRLAARSLLDAGRSLERLDRHRQAAGLYRELIESYSQTPLAAEARSLLEAMAKNE